jgi:hypothetical protein
MPIILSYKLQNNVAKSRMRGEFMSLVPLSRRAFAASVVQRPRTRSRSLPREFL